MKYIDLRGLSSGELKQVRRQVVRLKEMGKNRERNRGINRSTTESRQRNMDGVSAQWRSGFRSKQRRTSRRGRANSSPRGRIRNTGNDCEAAAEGIRDTWVSLDAEEDLCVCVEKIPEKDDGWVRIGLYAALGSELPASGKTCPETKSYTCLKVENGRISSYSPAGTGGKRRHILG